MKTRKRWYLLGGGIIFLIALFIGGKQWLNAAQTTEVLPEEKAQEIIEEKYPGKVISSRLENNLYTVDLERETGTYEIVVNARNGEVVSLKRTSQTTEPSSQNEENAPSPSNAQDGSSQLAAGNQNDSTAETVKRLTKEEAIQIALQQMFGHIDDIELESVNGVSYYFVEIENDHEKEAEVQIDAITGEVKSVTWND